MSSKAARCRRQLITKKIDLADALPLILTSTSAVVVSEKVDWTFFGRVLTHSEPPRALWDVLTCPRILGRAQTRTATLTASSKAYKKPTYDFVVAPWDNHKKKRCASKPGARG